MNRKKGVKRRGEKGEKKRREGLKEKDERRGGREWGKVGKR